jgi:hypothetical protein
MTTIFDDDAWNAVAKTLPPGINTDQARRELEQIGVDYRTMESARPRHVKACAEVREVYRQNRNPAKTVMLYGRIMDVWRQAGGKLAFSRKARGGPPRGRLVCFLDAVLKPILGNETPGAEGLRRIIEKERRRIAAVRAKASPTYIGFVKEHRGAPARWIPRKLNNSKSTI